MTSEWSSFWNYEMFLERKEAQFECLALMSVSAFSENWQGLSFLSSFFILLLTTQKGLASKHQSINVDACSTGSLWGCLCVFFFLSFITSWSEIFLYGMSYLYLTALPGWVKSAVSTLLSPPTLLFFFFNYFSHPHLLPCQMEISDSALFSFPISYPVTLWSLIIM